VGIALRYAGAGQEIAVPELRPIRLVAPVMVSVLLLMTPAQAAEGSLKTVTFEQPSLLSSAAEIARRALSPLHARRLAATNDLNGQPVDITKEQFAVYVPAQKPPSGYALLVFVPPWNDARLPDGWAAALDEHGVIFVSAAHSGNDTSVHFRRIPLALIAAQNLAVQYGVDPRRVFVSGFSGGSRVALRLALAYPDLFHGAILNAGSDPIGTADVALPPDDLLRRFQETTRLIYLTGSEDTPRLSMLNASTQSMRTWCVPDIHVLTMQNAGHDPASGSTLSEALGLLLDPASPNLDGVAACRAGRENEMNGALQQTEAAIQRGDKAGARQMLDDLDARFGGLAAPRSLALDDALR
jgi:hypothetical protein